jgi:transcription elongation factor S-II
VTASSQEPSTTSEKTITDPRYDALSASRKKIVDLLAEKLKLSCTDANSAVADFMACSIESGINSLYDSEGDKANYATKVRSLMFNLKSNEALRHNIIAGVVAAEDVAHLTPAQLASEEKLKEAAKAKEEAVMERRGDWVKISRDQLMRDNGLDPNKGGEFTCKKCKGTKTSHYAMQTRSADEPMTVFVCCLTCGNRWRTQ